MKYFHCQELTMTFLILGCSAGRAHSEGGREQGASVRGLWAPGWAGAGRPGALGCPAPPRCPPASRGLQSGGLGGDDKGDGWSQLGRREGRTALGSQPTATPMGEGVRRPQPPLPGDRPCTERSHPSWGQSAPSTPTCGGCHLPDGRTGKATAVTPSTPPGSVMSDSV